MTGSEQVVRDENWFEKIIISKDILFGSWFDSVGRILLIGEIKHPNYDVFSDCRL